jgi:hypothetical protein
MDRVHGAVDQRHTQVHGGPRVVRRCLASAWALGLIGAHQRGATGKGGHVELDGLLTGARATVWRSGDGGGLSSLRGRRRARRSLGERGKGVVRSGGGARLLWGSGEHRGGVAGEVTVALNVFNAIEDGEVKGRVKEGVLMAGRAKARGSYSRRGAGLRGVAGSGGIQWRHSSGRPARCGRQS